MKMKIEFKRKKKTYIKKLQDYNFKVKEDNFGGVLICNLDFIANYINGNDYWLRLDNKKCDLLFINLEDIDCFVINK